MEPQKDLYLLQPKDKPCPTQLFVTPTAIQRLQELKKEEDQNSNVIPRFRIRVDSGGCAGFQYYFNFDTHQSETDVVFSSNSLEFIVDEVSLGFLNSVILDYVEDMISSAFQLRNPNASASCGCGNSFSL